MTFCGKSIQYRCPLRHRKWPSTCLLIKQADMLGIRVLHRNSVTESVGFGFVDWQTSRRWSETPTGFGKERARLSESPLCKEGSWVSRQERSFVEWDQVAEGDSPMISCLLLGVMIMITACMCRNSLQAATRRWKLLLVKGRLKVWHETQHVYCDSCSCLSLFTVSFMACFYRFLLTFLQIQAIQLQSIS